MAKLFANSGDPDQTPCSAASDLGLLCQLPFHGFPDYNGLNIEKNCFPEKELQGTEQDCPISSIQATAHFRTLSALIF